MHQQTQNEDNLTPYKPSVLHLFTRDLFEAGNVYKNPVRNVPESSVEPVDTFIASMLAYERFHPSEASEWLLEDSELFYEAGMYNCGVGEYVDIDEMVCHVEDILEGLKYV